MSEISATTNPRPLVVRFGALGDMTILTALIRRLHERFGQPVDIVGSGGWTRPLFEGQPGVGELFLVGSRRWPYVFSPEQWKLAEALRARGRGATWLCDQDNRKMQRLLRRAGWRPDDWCEYLADPVIPGPHMCDVWQRFAFRNPSLLGGGDLPSSSLPPAYGELIVSEERKRAVGEWLASKGLADAPLILIQVGNKRTMRRGSRTRASNSKYWPEENWAAVLRRVRELHPNHAILLLGVPQESELNEEILQMTQIQGAFNMAHEVPIARLIALAARAVGMISVDTGPAHVAAAVGCPIVALFGKMGPETYGPRGPNTRAACLTGTHEGERSMLGIRVDEVVTAWRSLNV